MFLGSGITAVRESINYPKVKHLQLSYYNKLGCVKSIIHGLGFCDEDADNSSDSCKGFTQKVASLLNLATFH